MNLFSPSRDDVRNLFFNTWHKSKQQLPLNDLEKICLSVIYMHPEYHATLSNPDQFKNQEYFPELGETNPFLHMSLHISILEQICINQPFGINEIYSGLKAKHRDEHSAQHDVIDCLAEMIWLAQRSGTGLDSEHYLQLLQHKITKISK